MGSGLDEGPVGWVLLEQPASGGRAIYECVYPSGLRHLVSTQTNCEGTQIIGSGPLGWLWATPVTGSGPALYRCRWAANDDHMVSTASNCEGATVEGSGPLGYLAVP